VQQLYVKHVYYSTLMPNYGVKGMQGKHTEGNIKGRLKLIQSILKSVVSNFQI